jgi:hypothetical protein
VLSDQPTPKQCKIDRLLHPRKLQMNTSPCSWSENLEAGIVRSREVSRLCSQLLRSSRSRPRSEQSASMDRLAQQWLDLAADIEAVGEGGIPSTPVH